MKNLILLIIPAFFIFGFLLQSCDPPPIFDETPTLEWNRFTKDTVQQFSGQVSLVVDFTDGDGDLGGDTTYNMTIIDTRTEDTIFYIIPKIPNQGAANGISGEIEVDLSTICCMIPGFPILCGNVPDKFDSTTYRIRIRDRAKRWSNEVESKPIKIKCFQ